MVKPRVYVETTVPSFYYEVRTAPAIVARKEWTRQWWDGAADRYELVASPAVLGELSGGPAERREEWLRVNALLGLFVPALATPLELLGGSDDAETTK